MITALLVNPPRKHLVHLDTQANVDLGEISSFPPIGLMYVAQAVRDALPNVKVSIVDAVVEDLSHDDVARLVVETGAQVVGLTSFTFTFYDLWLTAKAIKKASPQTKVVIGGPHMYFFPEETMRHDCFDYGVVGDGEETFVALLRSLNGDGPDLSTITGIVTRREGVVVTNGQASVSDIDLVKVPAVDLLDTNRYFSTVGAAGTVGTICTSRGCPYKCTFCQVPEKKYRKRAVENVLDEIGAYLDLGVDDFFFFDDLFNISRTRVIELSEGIIARGYKIGWMFRGRVELVDDEMLAIARRSGLHTISVGIEAASDEGLREIKKKLTMAQAFEGVRRIRHRGIRCSANWIIGFPHQQTMDDLRHLLDTAIRIKSDYAQFSILQLMPGSELFDQAVAEGGLDGDIWHKYVLNPTPDFSPPLWERHFTKEELYAFYELAFRRYYMRPSLILRETLRVKSLGDIRIRAASFFSLVGNSLGLRG